MARKTRVLAAPMNSFLVVLLGEYKPESCALTESLFRFGNEFKSIPIVALTYALSFFFILKASPPYTNWFAFFKVKLFELLIGFSEGVLF